MTRNFPIFGPSPTATAAVRGLERACLAIAGMVAVAAVARGLFSGTGDLLHWAGLPFALALGSLACVASLESSLRERTAGRGLLSAGPAVVAAICAGRTLVAEVQKAVEANHAPGSMPGLVALAFVLLSIVLVLLPITSGVAGYAPDVTLFGLGWLVVGLVMGKALGAMHVFGIAAPSQIPQSEILELALLTTATFGRRMEHGHFSIFLSRGLGGRIARILLPIVLVLPAAREALRSRAVLMPWLPEHYAAGILASLGTMVALLLVILVARQLRRLEMQVQDLSLRDELTGLYNLRGFQLLAEQALRLSYRSEIPFSVLFVDVDDLKLINDRHGHGIGSTLLVEAAEFLKMQFRETDIVARIGGDEFAVAGHFTSEAITRAEERLQAASRDREHMRVALSLSMGHASTDPAKPAPLQNLLERADAAMYERKREKKLQAV